MRKLFDQELKQINFLDERFYKVSDGVYYPSVTHILDCYPKGAAFTQWLKDVGNSAKTIVEKAAESGTLVHNAIEELISGKELVWDEKKYNLIEWKGLLRFNDFFENFVTKVYAYEVQIFSHKHKYAGTVDFIGELTDGKVWLIDWKFGNAVYESHFLQIAAYKSAWNENSELKIDKYGILHLKAKTRGRDRLDKKVQGEGWSLIEPKESYERLFKIFTSVLNIYEFQNPVAKPANKIYDAVIKLKKL